MFTNLSSLPASDMQSRVRVKNIQLLSDSWGILRKTTFDLLRNDGTWQEQVRETYDRGDGVAILLYDRARRTVILIRQFRYPVYVNGHPGLLIEVPAGLLDKDNPEDQIRSEVEEETGFRVSRVQKILELYMSPGSVTEKLYFYIAEYHRDLQTEFTGGVHHEGEDIEVLELSIDDALRAIDSGDIMDGKTVLLLQYARLHLFA